MLRRNRGPLFLVLFGLALAATMWVSGAQTPRALAATTVAFQQADGATTTYVVQRGDNLSTIARRFGTTVNVLVALNKLANPGYLYVGQRLLIPTAGGTVPPATPTATPMNGGTVPPPTATATDGGTIPTATPTPAATSPWTPPADQIELFSPVAETLYHSPIEIIGYSQTFEGNVNLRLTDGEGNILAERNALGGAADGFAFFHSYLRFTVTEEMSATLELFETSAADGSELHTVTIPLQLLPGQRVIDIDTPAPGADLCSPLVISGYSNTFEANVVVELRSRDGEVLEESFTSGGNLGIYADFSTSFAYEATSSEPLLVGAYEVSARDGRPIDQTFVPVSFTSDCP